MTKPTTHVLIVTDMSGSMQPLAEDVRGGFNTYLDELAKDGGKYRLTVTLFDDRFESLCVAAKLKDVPRLTEENYRPRAMTALLDAVGKTVAEFDSRVPTLADGDRVLVVVQTDGAENASREFARDRIAALIKEREATGKWSFIYLGAGVDAWAQAGALGFAATNTVRSAHSGSATRSAYSGLTQASVAYSKGASASETSGLLAEALADDSN
ncbi:hypothetical protein K1W54_04905 [Micromonospora sp. CPCC 205371]|nr:hypothetical protein [Micromonospora sp. CPCC 205371]